MTPADPLAQLRDIHLPDPVAAWPPGPAWWLLAALALALAIGAAVWMLRRYRANAWRRQARAALNAAWNQWRAEGDDVAYLQAVNAILKRAALHQFPRESVAALSGAAWEAFLDAQWRGERTDFTVLCFADRAYRPAPGDVDMAALHRVGRQWVSQLRGAAC